MLSNLLTKTQREIRQELYGIPALAWHIDNGDKPSFLAKKMFFAIKRFVEILRAGTLRGNPLTLFPVISGLSEAWIPPDVLKKWVDLDSKKASHAKIATFLEETLL